MESKKPLTDLVYNKIYEEIISGELQAGDIITEKQIITRYGISRSPVREALISLCGENILCSIPRAGYQVVSFSHAEVKQLTEARLLLECYLLEKDFLLSQRRSYSNFLISIPTVPKILVQMDTSKPGTIISVSICCWLHLLKINISPLCSVICSVFVQMQVHTIIRTLKQRIMNLVYILKSLRHVRSEIWMKRNEFSPKILSSSSLSK